MCRHKTARVRGWRTHRAHQELSKRAVVGDHAVVHDHKLVPITAGVRVRVDGGWPAMRGPPDVANGCLRGKHLRAGSDGFQFIHLL